MQSISVRNRTGSHCLFPRGVLLTSCGVLLRSGQRNTATSIMWHEQTSGSNSWLARSSPRNTPWTVLLQTIENHLLVIGTACASCNPCPRVSALRTSSPIRCTCADLRMRLQLVYTHCAKLAKLLDRNKNPVVLQTG
eukprot:510090-Amphidinium_carterae.1